jgi:BirA family biotin operon repressor/biotin-[acetyl-CoA-carboxylase] ligase
MASSQQAVELLDSDKIKLVIEIENQRHLATLDIFDSINSTNTYLLECAKANAPSGSVCFAEQQKEGRGRLGRAWFSPRGANIYCSLLWYFPAAQRDLSALSLAVAVIVADTLRKYGIVAGIELKWPNDILFAGRKLAGILLERLPEKDGKIAVVMGIGLNLQLPPLHADVSNWIDVAEITGRVVARNYLAGLLVNELLLKMDVYQCQGLRPFLNDWQQYNMMRGKEIVVQTSAEKIVGVMTGITELGELLLLGDDGVTQRFRCGEVSVRNHNAIVVVPRNL